MKPLINPSIKIELKDGAFCLKDEDNPNQPLRPIDPLAVFIISLCDGKNTLEQIATGVKEKISTAGVNLPETIDIPTEIQKAIDSLSVEGILFLDEPAPAPEEPLGEPSKQTEE